jgi:exopolysaccharide biosynthesis protein
MKKNILLFESWLKMNESSYDNQGHPENIIKDIQTFLVKNGFMNAIRPNGKNAIDGMFGEESKRAFMEFQKSQSLPQTGIIDADILSKINSNYSQNNKTTIQYGVEQKLSIVKDSGEDKIEIIDPSTIKVVFSSDFKRMSISEWIQLGHSNFINLTFFESNGRPTGNFFANGINYGEKLNTLGKWWPMMVIKPELEIVASISEIANPIEAFSGSHILVKDGYVNIQRQGPKESAQRPRTGVGITKEGEIIVMVTPSSDIINFAKKLKDAGAYNAINMDGGGSSLFVRDNQPIFSTSRSVPTILTW